MANSIQSLGYVIEVCAIDDEKENWQVIQIVETLKEAIAITDSLITFMRLSKSRFTIRLERNVK
ncbi:hypothetical protein AB1I62_03965 [Enterococcus sp. AN402]|uniref:hypothetical protein n=1 Tax=Enterococcus sp. AN402 TaxID=3151386 RepID=UPI0034592769